MIFKLILYKNIYDIFFDENNDLAIIVSHQWKISIMSKFEPIELKILTAINYAQ